MADAGRRKPKLPFEFSVSDWQSDTLTIIRAGTPSIPGQIGPHKFPLDGYYRASTYKYLGNILKEVTLTVLQDTATGDIILKKAGLVQAFDGVALVELYWQG